MPLPTELLANEFLSLIEIDHFREFYDSGALTKVDIQIRRILENIVNGKRLHLFNIDCNFVYELNFIKNTILFTQLNYLWD